MFKLNYETIKERPPFLPPTADRIVLMMLAALALAFVLLSTFIHLM
jgi:hypothetical protein